MKMEGEIREIEPRETDKGQNYHRIQIDKKWGSYWGNMKDLEKGVRVKAEYEEVKNGQFTNWKNISPLDQEEKKDTENQSSSEKSGNGKVRDAKKSFEIRKQVALKAAVKTTENPTIGEIRKLFMTYVNMMSKRPDEFKEIEGEEEE